MKVVKEHKQKGQNWEKNPNQTRRELWKWKIKFQFYRKEKLVCFMSSLLSRRTVYIASCCEHGGILENVGRMSCVSQAGEMPTRTICQLGTVFQLWLSPLHLAMPFIHPWLRPPRWTWGWTSVLVLDIVWMSADWQQEWLGKGAHQEKQGGKEWISSDNVSFKFTFELLNNSLKMQWRLKGKLY